MRRLPVLQTNVEDDAPRRAPWQWVAIGAALAITLWIPLLTLSLWLRARVLAGVVPTDAAELGMHIRNASAGQKLLLMLSALGPVLVPWVFACAAAGALVGRFGGAARSKHAAYSGLAAAAAGIGVAALGGALDSAAAFASSVVALAGPAAAAGWLGGKFGERRRLKV